jgi:hypothetical protein
MKTMTSPRIATLFGTLLVLTVGCEVQTNVDLHEAGQYKGAKDPLLDVAGTEGFRTKLQERLQQVQTDR